MHRGHLLQEGCPEKQLHSRATDHAQWQRKQEPEPWICRGSGGWVPTLQSSPAPTLLSTDPGANQISLQGSMHHANATILMPGQESLVEQLLWGCFALGFLHHSGTSS